MSESIGEVAGLLDRQPTLQNVTWFLSLRKFGQLDLDPPYQRKSVWTIKEKRRFLDTVFRNYPSPAIFLHRSLDEEGNPTYHVVDGKQRLTTILDFVDNKLRLTSDFGDARLDGKNWADLSEFPSARKIFWGYQISVEFIDDVHEPLVREVFSRLNQNSRKLERQELRHARFDGWMIDFVEKQAMEPVWTDLKVATKARSRRMSDVQLLLEYAQALLKKAPVGFDQDSLDQLCADYDDVEALDGFDSDQFAELFESTARFVRGLVESIPGLSEFIKSRNNFYSVWAFIASLDTEEWSQDHADKLRDFVRIATELKERERLDPQRDRSNDDPSVSRYATNSSGAATEEPQRKARHEALLEFVVGT